MFNFEGDFLLKTAKLYKPLKCQENLHLEMSSVYVVF